MATLIGVLALGALGAAMTFACFCVQLEPARVRARVARQDPRGGG